MTAPGLPSRADRPAIVGVNLLWLVPGEVGGSEGLLTSVLRGIAANPPVDLDLHLFVLPAFGDAHPDLAKAFPHTVWKGRGFEAGASRPRRVLAENTWLARHARKVGVALMHHGGGIVPLLRGAPAVLTIHDLQPLEMPQNFSTTKRVYLRAMLRRSAHAARLVVTPSRFTKRTVVDLLEVAPQRVAVVGHGIPPAALDLRSERSQEVLASLGIERRHFVYPAITYPHKNHGVLLDAFAEVAREVPDVDLVLTGGQGPSEAEVLARITRPDLEGRVHRLGRITAEDLDVVLRSAAGLVFPSRYEGFGLPVLEAAAVGCPVVAASCGALVEVVPPGTPLVDPDDTAGWAGALTRLATDEDHRRELGRLAREWVGRFSPERSAEGLLAVYRLALDRGGAR